MARTQELVNRIRRKDLDYREQWQQYYLACLEWARCEGLPADACEAPPEVPSGPISGQETSLPTPPPG